MNPTSTTVEGIKEHKRIVANFNVVKKLHLQEEQRDKPKRKMCRKLQVWQAWRELCLELRKVR